MRFDSRMFYCLVIVSMLVSLPADTSAFSFTENPTLEMIPDAPISGQAGGVPFSAKTIVFEPNSDGTWSMIITDRAFESPTDILMDCQHITMDLSEMPGPGVKMSKPMEYGKGFFQITSPSDPQSTTSWNADNAWVLEITEWDLKPWDPDASMFQQAGVASGRVAVCYKGSGDFKNAWVAGTFKNAAIRYMGEPPESIKNASAKNPATTSDPIAPANAAASKNATWKSLGKAGDWIGTITGTEYKGGLVTAEKSGVLYHTNLASGSWKQIGKPDFAGTLYLFSIGNDLFSIEKSGSLYKINVSDGAWQSVGTAGSWVGTIAGTSGNGKIYTVESTGSLYVTDPQTGIWTQIGKPDFSSTRLIFFVNNMLVMIDSSGNMTQLNPDTGASTRKGQPGAWKETLAGAVLNGKIYTIESSGVLYETDPATGSWLSIGKPDYAATQFMFAAGAKLYTIESGGSLYEITID